MPNYATTIITFSDGQIDDQTADRAFESVGEPTPGTVIDMYAWSSNSSRLSGLVLRDGNFNSMGGGYGGGGGGSFKPFDPDAPPSTFEGECTETVSFSKSNCAQLSYPSQTILSMVARSGIIKVNAKGIGSLYRSAGSNLSGDFKLFNGSFIGKEDVSQLFYGAVNVRYQKGPHYKKWSWTVPNETATFFFFVTVGEAIVHNFSFDVEATDITGTEPRWVSILVKDQLTAIPLEGVEVVIDPEGINQTATTGADGIAAFEHKIPVGAYPITMTFDGYILNTDDDLDNDYILVQ
jgi:hypothetical protein